MRPQFKKDTCMINEMLGFDDAEFKRIELTLASLLKNDKKDSAIICDKISELLFNENCKIVDFNMCKYVISHFVTSYYKKLYQESKIIDAEVI